MSQQDSPPSQPRYVRVRIVREIPERKRVIVSFVQDSSIRHLDYNGKQFTKFAIPADDFYEHFNSTENGNYQCGRQEFKRYFSRRKPIIVESLDDI